MTSSQKAPTGAQAKLDLANGTVTAATKEETAKSKLTEVTQAAQKVSTALQGKTQSPEKDILSSVSKGYTAIARAVNSVDKPE